MGLVDSLMQGSKTAEETGVMDSAMDYGSAREWLSKVLPNPDEISGRKSGTPAWLSGARHQGVSTDTPITSWSGDATEFMSRDRLEAWGVPYDTSFQEGGVTGEQILNRNVRENIGPSSNSRFGAYSSQKDPAVGWSSDYHGEDFWMGQEAVFKDVSAMHKENPELWQSSLKDTRDPSGGSQSSGGYNFSEKQIDQLGANYKSFLKKDSPGYKKAASVFNWKD